MLGGVALWLRREGWKIRCAGRLRWSAFGCLLVRRGAGGSSRTGWSGEIAAPFGWFCAGSGDVGAALLLSRRGWSCLMSPEGVGCHRRVGEFHEAFQAVCCCCLCCGGYGFADGGSGWGCGGRGASCTRGGGPVGVGRL